MKRKVRNIDKESWQRKGKDERWNENERKTKEEGSGKDNFNDDLLCASSCNGCFNRYETPMAPFLSKAQSSL